MVSKSLFFPFNAIFYLVLVILFKTELSPVMLRWFEWSLEELSSFDLWPLTLVLSYFPYLFICIYFVKTHGVFYPGYIVGNTLPTLTLLFLISQRLARPLWGAHQRSLVISPLSHVYQCHVDHWYSFASQ